MLKGFHITAIFIATIAGIIAKPLPMGAIAMLDIAATALTGTLTIKESLSGFGNTTIWLIVVALFVARGFMKTGLGTRIGYMFMRVLGKRTLGLSYGLIATDLVLAPAIPSNTARGGGVIYPILRSIAEAYGSNPDDGTARKLGAFLTKTSFQTLVITSAMYSAFLAVAIAVGTPPMLAALVLAFFSNLMSSMTHYGTGPAPVFYGSGYVEMGTWWKLGLLISVVNIIIWLVIGGAWWKVLGLW